MTQDQAWRQRFLETFNNLRVGYVVANVTKKLRGASVCAHASSGTFALASKSSG